MRLSDAVISAVQGITATVGELDFDGVSIDSGQWTNLLRGLDADASTSIDADSATVTATNGDSVINFAGALNLAQDSSFSVGSQFLTVTGSDISVVGDLIVNVDDASGAFDTVGGILELLGDISTTGDFTINTGDGNDVLNVERSFGTVSGYLRIDGGAGITRLFTDTVNRRE